MTPINKQEIPEITNSLTFRTLLSSKVSVALLSYGNLSTLVFTVTSHTVVTMDLAMGPIVAQVWLQVLHKNGLVSMVTKLNPSWSNVDWCKYLHPPQKFERPLF
jgi:hypothetical protein